MTKPAEWGRRQAVVGAVSALTAALTGGLFKELGMTEASIAAWAIAAVLAGVTLWIQWRKGGIERAQEEQIERRGIRFQGLLREATDETPISLGVDPAAETDLLPGGRLPVYQRRSEDEELRSEIRGALDSRDRRLVVATGPPKRGKTRSLYEALRSVDADEGRSLYLVAPKTFDALLNLLDVANEGLDRPDSQIVLWLDDLEPFISTGLTNDLLTDWLKRYGGVAIGTLGGRGADIVAESGGPALVTPAQALLAHARDVDVSSLREVNADVAVTKEQAKEIHQHGLAAYLVAGRALRTALSTQRHGAEAACPVGVGIVRAAADWARCARTDPIPEDLLRELTSVYPHPGQRSGHGFDEGLSWALRPVAGSIALLQSSEKGYLAYSYAVTIVRDLHMGPPPLQVWNSAVKTGSALQLLAVGAAAFQQDLREFAVDVWQVTADRFASDAAPGQQVLVATALVLRGLGLAQLPERTDEAVLAYQQVIDQYTDDPTPDMRQLVATALWSKGLALAGEKRTDKAILAYQEVINQYGDDTTPNMRELVAQARVVQAAALEESGRPDKAILAYQEVINQYGDDTALGLRELVARSLFLQGVVLQREKRTDEAILAYQEMIDRYTDDPTPDMRQLVASALVNQGAALKQSGRSDEAIDAYQQVIDQYTDDPTPYMRQLVATALVRKGDALAATKSTDEAIDAYEEVSKRYAQDPAPALRELVKSAWLKHISVRILANGIADVNNVDEIGNVVDEMMNVLSRDLAQDGEG